MYEILSVLPERDKGNNPQNDDLVNTINLKVNRLMWYY